jgi:hypothetical protein
MADSIELYNGYNSINVNTLDILRQPNQQLANAIATGPQDEFFSKLEECNRVLSGYSNEGPVLSVTPSWNWRPGTLNIIKKYVSQQLMLEKKSSGLGKYLSRTIDNTRYRISWMATKLEQCEELKRMLKREGYAHDVNIEEYIVKLSDFCDKIEESANQAANATEGKVSFTPYIYIPENNERQATFYLDCYVNPGELNVCQDSTLIQKIPINGIKLMFHCSLRKMMRYLDKPSPSLLNVRYSGLNDAQMTNQNSYRARQTTYHPYVAQPTYRDGYGSSIQWGTACFSSFTDNIRNAFHQLNFIVLAMELLEWAGYYNTQHANPYNSLNLTHIGMPKSFSKAYQAVINRDAGNCSSRLSGHIFDKDAQMYSPKHNRDKVNFIEYCQNIECVWRTDCSKFIQYTGEMKRILNTEHVFIVESILGALLEHFSEETVTNSVLYEDFGIYLDNSLDENHEKREYMIYDWKDAIDALVMKYESTYQFEYILDEIKYWNTDEEDKVASTEEIEGLMNEEQIKREMLQWATERSI